MNFENIEYFEKYFLGELFGKELIDFEKRLAQDTSFAQGYADFIALLQKEEDEVDKPDYNKDQAWEAIQNKIYIPKSNEIISNETWWNWQRAASISIFLLIGVLAWWSLSQSASTEIELITKETANGQKATITLADGTTIRLNSGSTLSFPKEFSDSIRNVSLQGEAFFDVTPDSKRPFIISSGEIKTTVLGTSFNIKTFLDEETQEVAVKTGNVSISFGDGAKTVSLKRGDVLHYSKKEKEWKLSSIDPESIGIWSQGYIYFQNEPLGQVLRSLSRWYGVDFEVENQRILRCKITLKQRDENLKNILDIIKYASHVEYKFIDNKIIIQGKPC